MCGKFTAMASWSEVVEYSTALTSERDAAGSNDEAVTLKVMGPVNIIIWDETEQQHKKVPMRWGFPHPKNWRIPQPIHARGGAGGGGGAGGAPGRAGGRGGGRM